MSSLRLAANPGLPSLSPSPRWAVSVRRGARGLTLLFVAAALVVLPGTLWLLRAPPTALAAPSDEAAAQSRVEHLDAQKDQASLSLMLLEGRLQAAEDRTAAVDARVTELEQATEAAAGRREQAREDAGAVRARLADRLREGYKSGSVGWLQLLFTSEDLGELLQRARLLGRVVDSEAQLLDEVKAKGDAEGRAVAELESLRAEEAKSLESLKESRRELAQSASEQEALVAELGGRLEQARTQVEEARERMATLNREQVAARGDSRADSEQAADSGGGSNSAGSTNGDSGTKAPPAASEGTVRSNPVSAGAPRSGGRQIEAKVTAYALPGTTATGMPVGYGIIAVDPRVIPLGTRLYVPGYGEGIAADTGSAVKGNVVDVWLPSRDEALDWGIKHLTVTVYD